MSTGNEIRQKFLDFFAKNDHTVLPSSPLVPRNDPTLMFANSGMVQFKNYFTGAEKTDLKRATTSQKCVRAGGKHNDLENVGYTARHHTFFEMLGNFSFGDYFKERAIELAWNLITKEYGIDKKRLCVTVYHEDNEAIQYWKKIAGLGDDKIIRINTSDNFWSMGDTGPCGPCSEIFYDHGDKIAGGPPGSPDADGDRFVEIWNLVFMQYEQVSADKRVNLPKPSIDTGMGLERVSAVLQGVHNNYDTDLLRDLVMASADASGKKAEGSALSSHRVIADHLRASSFLIADGVLPSNEGRGYVLRRIMRRAMRHAHMLGCTDPHMYKLVPALLTLMGTAYPELVQAKGLITETLKFEEERFKITLGKGLKLLDEELVKLSAKAPLPGDVAFRLYDTFGFPLDLTQDVLRGQGRSVDTAGFEKSMQKQKEDARKAWAGSGEAADEKIWFEVRDKNGATEFLGYDTLTASGKITSIIQGGKLVDKLAKGAEAWITVNQTPFYGESGGQVGDTGEMKTESGAVLTVTDTQKKLGDVFAHLVKSSADVKVGDAVAMNVDLLRRNQIRAHHSATHLLHEALRQKLGTHVAQKGSLVSDERLRFDISHNKPMSDEEILHVETEVNKRIAGNTGVSTRLLPKDEAVALGAMAMFGEKYGDTVRVIGMGGVDAGAKKEYSLELCGGTHVSRTGDIGFFRVLSESAVAAGVRRIEGLAGAAAIAYTQAEHQILQNIADTLKVPTGEIQGRVQQLAEDRKRLERELSDLKRQMASSGSGGTMSGADIKDVGGIKFSARQVDGIPARDLKSVADTIRTKLGSGVIVVATSDEGRASMVISVTADLTARVSAVDLIKLATPILGGQGGGGRPEMAQGGGPDAGKIQDAFAAIENALRQKQAA